MSGLAAGNVGITRECSLRQSLQTVVNFLQAGVLSAIDVASLLGKCCEAVYTLLLHWLGSG